VRYAHPSQRHRPPAYAFICPPHILALPDSASDGIGNREGGNPSESCAVPLVSVIIPSHNRPEWLAAALASVRAQTFTDYEIIVVSNGESVEAQHKSRCAAQVKGAIYFALDDGNLPAARNFGVTQASGEWLAFLDDDDVWLPTKLERQLAAARRTGAEMVTTDYVEFYPCGLELARHSDFRCGRWHAPPSAVLVRRQTFDAVCGFDPAFLRIEDSDLWRRISLRHTIHQVREILVRYRRGHLCMTRDMRATYRYELRHFQKMWRDTPRDLRSSLPRWWSFVPRRLIGILMPNWIRAAGRIIRPRYRLLRFLRWFNSGVHAYQSNRSHQ
jgi:glycosyltransferase involved in cell wall biosynthesis